MPVLSSCSAVLQEHARIATESALDAAATNVAYSRLERLLAKLEALDRCPAGELSSVRGCIQVSMAAPICTCAVYADSSGLQVIMPPHEGRMARS